MSDQALHELARYCADLDDAAIPDRAVERLKRHLLDSIGCALGARHETSVRIAQQIAASTPCEDGASLFDHPQRTSMEFATFANTCAIRALDFNDTGIGGHPSDMIAALLAVCEYHRRSGRDLMRGMFAAYEAYAALRRGGMRLREKHVDQLQCTIATAVGLCSALRLDYDSARHAISLALTPSIPLRVTRTGELSHWKGCATAHAAMQAVFATRLARAGLTGPDAPFSGIAGLYDLLHLPPLDLSTLGQPRDGRTGIEQTALKRFPAEYSAQGPIELALRARLETLPEEIERIELALHWGGWHEIGGGQGDRVEKWQPNTRESADHSAPYLLARAWLDGTIEPLSFTPEKIGDERCRALMRRIEVVEAPELTERHRGELPSWPSRLLVVTRSGVRLRYEIACPRGHPLNPLADAEVHEKFERLTRERCCPQRRLQLQQAIQSLESQADLREMMDALARASESVMSPAATVAPRRHVSKKRR